MLRNQRGNPSYSRSNIVGFGAAVWLISSERREIVEKPTAGSERLQEVLGRGRESARLGKQGLGCPVEGGVACVEEPSLRREGFADQKNSDSAWRQEGTAQRF